MSSSSLANEGFIYLVTFLLDGTQYIGKKSFWKTTRTGRKLGESNWRRYFTSSERIHELLRDYPLECFAWEIILLCATKAQLSHAEANIIHKADAITKEGFHNARCDAVKWVTRDYPHRIINHVIRNHIMKHTWEHDHDE